MLNLAEIQSATLKRDPYPYMVVEDVINADAIEAILGDFPAIDYPGSIPVSEVRYGPAFQTLLDELNGPAFRDTIAARFGLDLANRPIMTTVRGVMRDKDGRIHTDSKTKVITVLLYFNQDWRDSGGHLRILRNGTDLDDFVEEIPPKLGTMVVFQVTDNCWHGHKPVVGKRLSIQMNYLTGEAARGKHQFFHRLSARLKKLFARRH
ncbi:MAG: 2OG-Fe(II) oxygenase [Porticoccaceae bacterium]|nr:2OG-Fe(II) oxygenase [Porticoccaceae bacterium]HLS97092.1 2OG-Fe(II) oxygenase [Porticoccaceae bacterium]